MARARRSCEATKTGAPGRIRTCDLLIRSQALYPTELQAQCQKLYQTNPILHRGPTVIYEGGYKSYHICTRKNPVWPVKSGLLTTIFIDVILKVDNEVLINRGV